MAKEEAAEILSIDGRDVRVTNPDKPYFSRDVKLSKLEIVQYYLAVADGAVAGIRDRPIVLKRFVDGAEGQPFYQKRAPTARPPSAAADPAARLLPRARPERAALPRPAAPPIG